MRTFRPFQYSLGRQSTQQDAALLKSMGGLKIYHKQIYSWGFHRQEQPSLSHLSPLRIVINLNFDVPKAAGRGKILARRESHCWSCEGDVKTEH